MLLGVDSYCKYNTDNKLKNYWINKNITENVKIKDMNRDNMKYNSSNKKLNNS